MLGLNGDYVPRHVVEGSSISTDRARILLHPMAERHVLDLRLQAKVVIHKDVLVKHVFIKSLFFCLSRVTMTSHVTYISIRYEATRPIRTKEGTVCSI